MIDAKEVYELLREIPHGRVTTYGAIAERLPLRVRTERKHSPKKTSKFLDFFQKTS